LGGGTASDKTIVTFEGSVENRVTSRHTYRKSSYTWLAPAASSAKNIIYLMTTSFVGTTPVLSTNRFQHAIVATIDHDPWILLGVGYAFLGRFAHPPHSSIQPNVNCQQLEDKIQQGIRRLGNLLKARQKQNRACNLTR